MKAEHQIVRGARWAQYLLEILPREPEDVGEWMEQHGRTLKRGVDSRVGLLEVKNELCCLKFYRRKSAVQSVLFQLGFSRAVRSFDMALELGSTAVAVPEPLACIRVADGLLLLTEYVPESVDLKSHWAEPISDQKRAQLMAGAGSALAQLHSAGYSHGDFKWSNLLVAADKFFMVDLEAVRKCSQGGSGVSRDLARFTVNAEDLALAPEYFESFLASYTGAVRRDVDAVKREMLAPLKRLRRRHLHKYGNRGHQLI